MPRDDDPRVVRSRAAVVEAATTLFLQKGYAGTTMEDIATLAGITKRTVYNNYTDKETLFTQIVADVLAFADEYVVGLRAELSADSAVADVRATLHGLGRRLAIAIVRPEVVALRRLLVGEARAFPKLGAEYFDRAPGQVIEVLASGFRHLVQAGVLRATDTRRAAEQFAYLIVGEPLDRAVLVGGLPTQEHIVACAREGVETFLARYATDARIR